MEVPDTVKALITSLIDATYDTGYYAGKIEAGADKTVYDDLLHSSIEVRTLRKNQLEKALKVLLSH